MQIKHVLTSENMYRSKQSSSVLFISERLTVDTVGILIHTNLYTTQNNNYHSIGTQHETQWRYNSFVEPWQHFRIIIIIRLHLIIGLSTRT